MSAATTYLIAIAHWQEEKKTAPALLTPLYSVHEAMLATKWYNRHNCASDYQHVLRFERLLRPWGLNGYWWESEPFYGYPMGNTCEGRRTGKNLRQA
jgi:hypothetical protein